MLNSAVLFLLATPLYLFSFLLYLVHVVFSGGQPRLAASVGAVGGASSTLYLKQPDEPSSRFEHWGRWVGWTGVVLTTVGVIWRMIELGTSSGWVLSVFLPVTTTYETLTFFSWIIPVAYFALERRHRFPGVGMIIMLIAFMLLGTAAMPAIAPRAVAPIVPALQSYWLVIHVLMMIVGIAFFTTGFGATLLLIWRRKRGWPEEALRKLEQLSYRSNAIAFPLYGIGGIILGGIWAKYAWGAYWEWDPKETAMLIAWLSYAVYLHARVRWGAKDRRVSWLSLVAYGVLMYAWIGINYFVSSLHSFA